MRISDWSSDVCSSDLQASSAVSVSNPDLTSRASTKPTAAAVPIAIAGLLRTKSRASSSNWSMSLASSDRSEEHTSELQSLMRLSYAVFCLKKTKQQA